MVSVERLYELCNVITDAKNDAGKHGLEFSEILTAVKGGTNEKRLASQFIARFYPLFPALQEQALNAQFDLCEDDDPSIRKQAIKDLPTLCKHKLDLVPKVADILAQLLQVEDTSELVTVQNSLVSLLKLDAKGTLTGLFYQMENSEHDIVCERCVKFLHSKLQTLGSQIFNSDMENFMLIESKKVFQNSSEEVFILLMTLLKELKVVKTAKGIQVLMDSVSEQCDSMRPFDATDVEAAHRLVVYLKQILPFFSVHVKSTYFVEYLYSEVLPVLDQLETMVAASQGVSSTLTLDLLKLLAELMYYSENLKNIEEKVHVTFLRLLEVMPLPPLSDASEALQFTQSFEFSRVECLLYLFHLVAKHHPEFLASNPDRLKDFRIRLQYFARGSQAYQKQLREDLSKAGNKASGETVIKTIALKTTANINALIKDLFHQPPSYKTVIMISWKSGKKTTTGGEKRHVPITFDSPKSKEDRKIYAPPRDKYSRIAGQFRSKSTLYPRQKGCKGYSVHERFFYEHCEVREMP